MRIIQASFIVPLNGEIVENGYLFIEQDGTLIHVTDQAPITSDFEVELYEGILCPGFVNTHCHLELSHMKGLIPEASGLPEFVNQIPSLRNKSTENPLEAMAAGNVNSPEKLNRIVEGTSIDGEIIEITNDITIKKAQQNIVRYDKNGEQHYDIISAFIKSIRGNDPNAGLYWLARMISGGEDPKFIARRLLIIASEDIGNANPTALVIANNCFQAVSVIGYPEARITLSQTVIYLACSEKSNSAYIAIKEAINEVQKSGNLTIPLHLRNAPTKLLKELGYTKNYISSHKKKGTVQEFLPNEISNVIFYQPSNNAREKKYRESLKKYWDGKYNY